METEVRDLQEWNAASPMEVTESGMVMLVRNLHLENAATPMEVIPCGMV